MTSRNCRSSSSHLLIIRRRPQFRIQQQRQMIFHLVLAIIIVTNFSFLVVGFSSLASIRRSSNTDWSKKTQQQQQQQQKRRPSTKSDIESVIGGNDDNNNDNNNDVDDDNNSSDNLICAAVLVPGFLTGAAEFEPMCKALTDRGLPTVCIGMPNWHWLPCLGGRSARPILERIDFTVKHLIANDGDVTKIPPYEYNLLDTWRDFRNNPGGVLQVGGSSKVDDYPIVEPQGRFPLPKKLPKKKVALIGHSAGGWISRIYLSSREYGGRAYRGSDYIHSLVTLGTPHASAVGPAFEGVSWINQETVPVRSLSVAGTGFSGGEWGDLTRNSYSFCSPDGADGSLYDGDGVTPTFSALAMPGSEQMLLEDVSHFCWSDVFGGNIVSPELFEDHKEGRPWYGSDRVVSEWSSFIVDHIPQCNIRDPELSLTGSSSREQKN